MFELLCLLMMSRLLVIFVSGISGNRVPKRQTIDAFEAGKFKNGNMRAMNQ